MIALAAPLSSSSCGVPPTPVAGDHSRDLCWSRCWSSRSARSGIVRHSGHGSPIPTRYYSKVYFPFDKPGFGVDTTPPLRPVPRELAGMEAWSGDVHRSYVPSTVPSALAQRILAVLITFGDGWRIALVLLLFASCVRSAGAVRLAIVECACLFAAYLVFAQPPEWVVYLRGVAPDAALHGCRGARSAARAGDGPYRRTCRRPHDTRMGINGRGARAPSALCWRPAAGACTNRSPQRISSTGRSARAKRSAEFDTFRQDTPRHRARTSPSRATSPTWRTRDRGSSTIAALRTNASKRWRRIVSPTCSI